MFSKIKTVKAALKKMGTSMEAIQAMFAGIPDAARRAHAINTYVLETVIEAINEGWQADWSNTNEWKYYPWWRIEAGKVSSAVGLSYDGCGNSVTRAHVGARLVFQSVDRVKHMVQYFKPLYEAYYSTLKQ